ncbi:hypothetical protein AALM99_07735, partial [Lactococcus muris]
HVDGQLISPDRINDFLAADPNYTHHDDLSDFLTAVQNGSIDNNWGNPGPEENVQPDQINFSIMAPGTIFTMAGEQYRYLENQGGGNHLIIRNDVIENISFNNQDIRIDEWYESLDVTVQAMVRPVANEFVTGELPYEDILWSEGISGWMPDNINDFIEISADVTRVNTSGSPQAFALSFVDVVRLSEVGHAFSSLEQRESGDNRWWWLRTPRSEALAWSVLGTPRSGQLGGGGGRNFVSPGGGIRPAIIIHQ